MNNTNLIIQRVLSGDTEAFREIVREYGLSHRIYLASKMLHIDDVDDVAAADARLAARRIARITAAFALDNATSLVKEVLEAGIAIEGQVRCQSSNIVQG